MLGMIGGFFIVGRTGAIIGAILGGLFAVGAARANVRPLIAVTTFAGAAAGALIGASVVETICLPDTCPVYEFTGALVLGLASIVGVGLVAALVARSFDEYNESVIKGEDPPGPGCETPD
jgi:hypothetical protein